jgi:low temperature requirement protein LtrA
MVTWIKPMVGRSPDEQHRASTPLELFFDLVLVVAVAFASSELHQDLAGGARPGVILSYCMVFFAIWWPWMNFTWFASAFDTDDVAYRLLVFVQMTGALIVAAGVPRLFEDLDLGLVLVGYVVMRLAAVTQWLRAARSDVALRPSALRYAIGIGTLQLAWVALYFAPEAIVLPGLLVLIVAELAVPVWAERHATTTWHPAHIAERYGLFTIIVLGESILSASIAVQAAAGAGQVDRLLGLIAGGLLTVFAMWWLYFELPGEDSLTFLRRAFVWGYGHYFIWAAAAAVGAGLAVALEESAGQAAIGKTGAGLAVAVPVAVYLSGLWAINYLPRGISGSRALLGPLFAILVLLTPLTGNAVLLIGLVLSALVAVKVLGRDELGSTEVGID